MLEYVRIRLRDVSSRSSCTRYCTYYRYYLIRTTHTMVPGMILQQQQQQQQRGLPCGNMYDTHTRQNSHDSFFTQSIAHTSSVQATLGAPGPSLIDSWPV